MYHRWPRTDRGEVVIAFPFMALSEPWRGEFWETGHLLTLTAGLSHPELPTYASLSVPPPTLAYMLLGIKSRDIGFEIDFV